MPGETRLTKVPNLTTRTSRVGLKPVSMRDYTDIVVN